VKILEFFFCSSVNSTNSAIFFWKALPNSSYQKIEKTNPCLVLAIEKRELA